MKNQIIIKNLTKTYPQFKLDNINLELPLGCIIGLIGENGAGKTTLIKLLLNIIPKDSGSITLNGKSLDASSSIGVVLDNAFFPEILTPKDINSIMKNIYKTWNQEQFFKYLEDFKIPLTSKIKSLSKGMRKKLEIATALSHNPKLLILDEPTSGLDPIVRSEILEMFQSFVADEEHTIIMSSHITTDLEHIADLIIFIDNGNIVLNELKDDIIDSYGILKCSEEEFPEIDQKDIIRYKKHKYSYDILIKNRTTLKSKYKDFIIDKITLDELMLLIVKGEKIC